MNIYSNIFPQAAVPPVSGVAAVGPVGSVPPAGIPAAPAAAPVQRTASQDSG